jgi:hypothetical protein
MAQKATTRLTVIAMRPKAGGTGGKINVKKGSDSRLLEAIKAFFEKNPDVERLIARRKTEKTKDG